VHGLTMVSTLLISLYHFTNQYMPPVLLRFKSQLMQIVNLAENICFFGSNVPTKIKQGIYALCWFPIRQQKSNKQICYQDTA